MQNYADHNPRLPKPFDSSVHACLLTKLAFPEQNISAKVTSMMLLRFGRLLDGYLFSDLNAPMLVQTV